mmetsp:Transcript_89183/g.186371  ORF Transcript_89183/g.186371 Transcript_89183/m.186371 type:complete len:216 (-) Transcript_89183:142-789(-)
MACTYETRFSFLKSHGGPGSRHAHSGFEQPPQLAPTRVKSLPQLGIPAGYSAALGNRQTHETYSNLRGAFQARLDTAMFGATGGRHPNIPPPRKIRAEEWCAPERVRPESLPAAGMMKKRIQGKRLVPENTNTLSHVDTLIWGLDMDGSDGILAQGQSTIYSSAAGLNAKAEKVPIYGHLPPKCVRTFGPDGAAQTFESISYARRDPRADVEGRP